jgi:hypothetical protein
MNIIEQQIEDLKTKIKTIEKYSAFLASQELMSEWDRGHVIDACGRVQRKMEKELRSLLVFQIKSGQY